MPVKLLLSGIAVAALATTTPAVAAAPTDAHSTTAAPQASTPPPKERKVCRTVTRSGSNMTTQVCKTRAQWEAIAANYDSDSEPGVPGNRAATGRNINRGGSSASLGPPG
jgi:hypothetical protein